ncbi:MAG: ribosome maturation factor RimM [Gammaproteobacteria bacterium]|nr:ribosome maturation factor RimM [Gammaproteobacteria bacterium]
MQAPSLSWRWRVVVQDIRNMSDTPQIITLGSIGRPYGLKGWMRLNSYTDPSENILHYPNLFIQKNGHWLPFQISAHDIRHSSIHIQIDGCDNIDEAKLYTGCAIGTMRGQFPKLGEDEHYWADLEGLTVVNKEGVVLGQISHLFGTGANDIIVVKGDQEHLLPYIRDIVLGVDLNKKEMLVDWDPDF